MSLESDVFDTLKALVSNRCFLDVAPLGTALPYIVCQQVGGEAFNFLEGAVVGKRNARMQIACWATTRLVAADLARSAEDALLASTLNPRALGAMTAEYEEETARFGTRQDFSFFY